MMERVCVDDDVVVGMMSQEALEKQLIDKVNVEMAIEDRKHDAMLVEKVQKDIRMLREKLESLNDKLYDASELGKRRVLEEQHRMVSLKLQAALESETFVLSRTQTTDGAVESSDISESKAELIRTGKITPFSHLVESNDPLNGDARVLPSECLPDNRPVRTFFPQAMVDSVGEDYGLLRSTQQRQRRRDLKRKMAVDDGEFDAEFSVEESAAGSSNSDPEPESTSQYLDDGNEDRYIRRLQTWTIDRQQLRIKLLQQETPERADASPVPRQKPCLDEIVAEMVEPSPGDPDAYFPKQFKLPGEIYSRLFEYQRIGVKWLHELHHQHTGGIVGDEMGLGKSIQTIAYLAGLSFSNRWPGAAVIVCPATIMKQWVQEFHRWWPPLRVVILHPTGASMKSSASTHATYQKIVAKIHVEGHVLITTYATVRNHKQLLTDKKWGVVILDEGHQIRNPDAEITLTCKQFQTQHRIILSGTPIQNNLTELWSLFDFVYPGRLGTLPVFQDEFATPIKMGGYANASAVQVHTAYKCACILRDLINPYLLRRMKNDVAKLMPKKDEHVVFCRLSALQRQVYEDFLQSHDMQQIFEGRRDVLFGIDILRKICNHPDLLLPATNKTSSITQPTQSTSTHVSKSGKLQVLDSLLKLWHAEKHRVLVFSQSRRMLDILESVMRGYQYSYRRMDGSTPITARIPLVDEFNARPDIFVFLLTTRVGGLGVNLVGANRVLIFDPDWNPSTDMQARERAWRLGQKRDVAIYRLMTSGTIEEKIYHRQIFKQFLTNKILKNPKQRRFFKSSDLYDLFNLATEHGTNETLELFPTTTSHSSSSEVVSSSSSDVVSSSHSPPPPPTTSFATTHPILDHESESVKALQPSEFDGIRKMNGVTDFKLIQEAEQSFLSDPQPPEVNASTADPASRIVNDLFGISGVHAVMHHDAIVNADTTESILLEKEASRLATNASIALRKSRSRRQQEDISVPTWTGRSGIAGAPKHLFGHRRDQPRVPNILVDTLNPTVTSSSSTTSPMPSSSFGHGGEHGFSQAKSAQPMRSSDLLSNLKNRSNSPNLDLNPHTTDELPSNHLLCQMTDFLLGKQNNKCSSQEIIQKFQTRVTGNDVVLFRKMLKEVAIFKKQPNSSSALGFWELRNEFKKGE